jgi:transcription termination factor Rho
LSDTTDVTSDVPTDQSAEAGATRRRRTGSGLTAMLLPELQTMASSLGVQGTARMRKGELIAAIQELQGDGRVPGPRADAARDAAREAARDATEERTPRAERSLQVAAAEAPRSEVRAEVRDREDGEEPASRPSRRATRAGGPPEPRDAATEAPERERSEGRQRNQGERNERGQNERGQNERSQGERGDRVANERGDRQNDRQGDRQGDRQSDRQGDRERGQGGNGSQGGGQGGDRGYDGDDDGEGGGRRSRRSRFRDRRSRSGRSEGGGEQQQERGGREPQVADDDVLVPVAGIVDVLENYAFVRTSGYLSGSNDVYVSMSQVKRYGLRRGDAVTGAVRATRDNDQTAGQGNRRDKYNPLVRLDTINGMDPEEARRRPEFYKLTPLYPQERLRLETEPNILTTRVIDLVMPIGKGQRALIVSPPKAGKTMVLQAIANAITRNNPECHLMVVLVDERPEEVTDMQRSVKGEVIASTFDRPPSDHTTVSELSIERAKRLVELGHDVVVLLDSITRLGRAYNNASPASGRILSGGIDSTALYPPKRFLGAARNIENGGSLTIIATALVETGSTGDTVIFEEFKGTGNAELKLDRKIADKRVFPAIDIDPSGTRKEEILLAPEELGIVLKLRKVLHALDSQQAIDLLLDRLKKTRTNIEFLMQIAQSTPGD